MVNLAAGHSRRRRAAKRALQRLASSANHDGYQPTYVSDMSELERLSPQARAVLYLAEVEGYRFAEIAQMLGCSEPAARKRASRARKHLRVEMALEGPR